MKFINYLIEQSTKKEPKLSKRSELRLAIQQGQVNQELGPTIRDEVRTIIKRHIKGDEDWRLNQHQNDLGLIYTGDDPLFADAVVDGIIGDIFGYFQDGPKREVTRVISSKKELNGRNRTVYKVVPRKGKSQIQFFRVDQIEIGEPALGVLIL